MADEGKSYYNWSDAALNQNHSFLLPAMLRAIEALDSRPQRIFDLGCGNGSLAAEFAKRGYDVTGVDPSEEGIQQAALAYPHLKLYLGSAYDDLPARFGQFPVVYSAEVVEHLYDPRRFARCLFGLVADGGLAIVTTPYHGYLKDLLLALTGKMDSQYTALWDHGHIKFWSRRTLGILLTEAGFKEIRFQRLGRMAPLARNLIALARK